MNTFHASLSTSRAESKVKEWQNSPDKDQASEFSLEKKTEKSMFSSSKKILSIGDDFFYCL